MEYDIILRVIHKLYLILYGVKGFNKRRKEDQENIKAILEQGKGKLISWSFMLSPWAKKRRVGLSY